MMRFATLAALAATAVLAQTAWAQTASTQVDGQDKAPPSTGMPWLTWEASAQQVLNAVERQQWYKRAPTN